MYLQHLLKTLEVIDIDPEFMRIHYKGYGIGWYDIYQEDKTSIRIYNRVDACPIIKTEDAYIVDQSRIEKPNNFIVCPVGGRIQTYSMGGCWDNSIIPSSIQLYQESSAIEKEVLLTQTIRRVLSFIDLNI